MFSENWSIILAMAINAGCCVFMNWRYDKLSKSTHQANLTLYWLIQYVELKGLKPEAHGYIESKLGSNPDLK